MSTLPASAVRSAYPVGSPTRACAATGRALETGEPYVAVLVLAPAGQGTDEFQRLDFSLEAWNAGARPRTDSGRVLPVFGFWRATVPQPGARRRILIDDESLLDLFEQTGSDVSDAMAAGGTGTPGADDRRAFRFMLALILLRKKLIVCERTGRDGAMYVRPRSAPRAAEGGVLAKVDDPGLSEDSVAAVVGQLSAVLDGEQVAGPTPAARSGDAT